ncbi:MAG: tetratricopeptide repeat protein [Candidatus Cloacimonetes bacterium]|nr:tetratricopeptide repeat protein [Candidatus Cloacimonadota bacterium]
MNIIRITSHVILLSLLMLTAGCDKQSTHLKKGIEYFNVDLFELSLSYFDQALVEKTGDIETTLWKVRTLYQLRKYDEAKALVNTILRNEPNHVMANYRLGDIYYKLRDYEAARKQFEKVVALDIGFAQAYADLGLTWSFLDNQKNALKYYHQGLNINPDDSRILMILAKDSYNKSDTTAAYTYLQRALDAAPYNPELPEIWGHFLNRRGDGEKSLHYFDLTIETTKRAEKVDPTNAKACFIGGRYALRSGDPETGEIYLKKAFELQPLQYDYGRALAAAYSKQKKWQQALETMENIAEIKRDRDVIDRLGWFNSELGNKDLAIKLWRESADMGSRVAVEKLEELGIEVELGSK